MSPTSIPVPVSAVRHSNERWRHLILGVICMIMIANFQYGWSVFVLPLQNAHGWSVANIQIAFTIFVALETWATPMNGWIADRIGPRIGPRIVMGAGGILIGLGWIIDSYAVSLPALYIGGALSGLGSGAVYCSAVGTAVKWFKDHRGLAVGLVAGGFGAGAALTTSALLWNGPDHIGTMLTGLHTWLDAREFTSLKEVRGIMSQRNVGNPQAFERANYIKILQGYRAPGISTTVPQEEIARSRNGSALVGRSLSAISN